MRKKDMRFGGAGEKSVGAEGVNMRLGRIGMSEGASAAAIAMTAGGIFGLESSLLYASGNSSFITLPLAALVSLAVFLLIAAMMEKCGAGNLGELLKTAFGAFSPLAAFGLALIPIYAAYAPLSQFVRAMHGLFFDGVSYSRIVVFTFPAVLVCALLGFETIGRTARLIAPVLMAVLVLSAAASSVEFEAYRLFPLLGNGMTDIAAQVLRGIGVFLPALLCLLVNADGLNGLATARRAGMRAAAAGALVLLAVQLSLGLCYTYKQLAELFMPFFRINYLNKFEAHLMRMDKLAHMTWLGGAMLAGAFHIHAGARLFSQGFEIRDLRPAASALALTAALMIMLETESRNADAAAAVKRFMSESGFILAAAPPLIAGMLAVLRKKTVKRRVGA